MKNEKEISWDTEIMEKCPILYCMRNKSMMETCMCWGFECGEGWREPLWKLSAALETLNMTYWPKYHIRIQMDQLKEKFGVLHAYYSVVRDGVWHKRVLHNFFYGLYRKLKTVDYKLKRVQDEAPYVEHKKVELKTKEEFVREQHCAKNVSNVKVWEEDGKYWKQTDLQHYGKYSYVPTRLKLLHKLMNVSWKLACRLNSYGDECTREQEIIMKFMNDEAKRLIKIAEDKCYDTCEDCGANIGKNGFNKRCETTGWITYICDECAKKHNNSYYMDGALYNAGKCLKTKEQIEAERADIEAKYEANRKKYREEQKAFEKELEAAREEDIKTGRVAEEIFVNGLHDVVED